MTKICIIKAMVFPVVVYRYESWTIKKAEHQIIGAFKLWCWRTPLRVLLIAKRSNQSILKKINLEYSWEGLPWWSKGWKSACQCRKYWFNPWSKKILHAMGQQIPCITAYTSCQMDYWKTFWKELNKTFIRIHKKCKISFFVTLYLCVCKSLQSAHCQIESFSFRKTWTSWCQI